MTSGVARRAVASAATALAPFSQNSNVERWSRSGQAQPGQSKPSGWLACSSVLAPFTATPCSFKCLATLFSAPQPPAGPSYSSIFCPLIAHAPKGKSPALVTEQRGRQPSRPGSVGRTCLRQ